MKKSIIAVYLSGFFFASFAFAHGKGHGPCAPVHAACKAANQNSTEKGVVWQCVKGMKKSGAIPENFNNLTGLTEAQVTACHEAPSHEPK